MPDVKFSIAGLDFAYDSEKGDTVDIRFTLKPEDELTEEQIKEIEASRNIEYVADEDSPLLDPEKTPELWNKALEALGD